MKERMSFKAKASQMLKQENLGEILKKATSHSLNKRAKLVSEEPRWEEMRSVASEIRRKTIDHLGFYLNRFIETASENGIQVHQMLTAFEANSKALEILSAHNIHTVVKAKSMLTEELGLNRFLLEHGIEVTETDLGEYIIQQLNEAPSHITAPAIHKSRQEVGKLFQELFHGDYTDDPGELTYMARKALRDKFLSAGAGISGANFLIADHGMAVILENEGNIRLSTSLPSVHIIFAGIEKLLPRLKDLGLFLRLLPVSATGQRMTSYLNLIKTPGEDGGPREIHLILVDNGRTNLLAEPQLKEALHCIKCGACMNICPIFQMTGGHAYQSTYPGPIGSLLTPLLKGIEKAADLPFASTLCGACSSVCPVKIPLSNLLLLLRNRAVMKGLTPLSERFLFRNFLFWTSSERRFRIAGNCLKLFSLLFKQRQKSLYVPGWSFSRDFPRPAKQSFRKLWKKEHEHK